MSPATVQLIIFCLQEAIQEYPALVTDLQSIFGKTQPTEADFLALRVKVASESYLGFVPQSALAQVEQNNVDAAQTQLPRIVQAIPPVMTPPAEISTAVPPVIAIQTPVHAMPSE